MAEPSWMFDWDGKGGSGFRGCRAVHDSDDLASVLAMRDPGGDAEFHLHRPSVDYPVLFLHVHADRWYLYFFPDEDEAGAFAVGDDPGAAGSTRMPAGCDIEVGNGSLVSGEIALRVAAEFMATVERPDSVEWVDM
ncbi:MAG: hypothetical protein J2P25_11815 [Nocardiopsaceae bacterium]|nr:hypothetical protein [Nocardiopsaceae bacterium]